jgi:hypothetical protein
MGRFREKEFFNYSKFIARFSGLSCGKINIDEREPGIEY